MAESFWDHFIIPSMLAAPLRLVKKKTLACSVSKNILGINLVGGVEKDKKSKTYNGEWGKSTRCTLQLTKPYPSICKGPYILTRLLPAWTYGTKHLDAIQYTHNYACGRKVRILHTRAVTIWGKQCWFLDEKLMDLYNGFMSSTFLGFLQFL